MWVQDARGKFQRMRGHGKLLPPFLNTKDPEASLGTKHLRTLDPNLIVGLDTRLRRYVIYGPSLQYGGWVPLCECMDDDGRYHSPPVPWLQIVDQLRFLREGPLSADLAEENNQRRQSAQDAADSEDRANRAEYFDRAIQGEIEGWGRWDERELADGYRSANEGRSKAEPRGRVYSLPGNHE